MEMHQVRYFLAVSRLLNFTRAAEECNVAQPSLTRAIKKLEEELGGELFRRERRATHPTELGRMMLPLLSQCYEGAQTAKTLAGSYATGEHAPLSLAISKSANMTQFVGPFTELARALPGLSLSFFRGTGAEVGERLKSGEAELAIAGPFADPWERLIEWPLFTETFTLVVHRDHPFAERHRIDPGSLTGARFLARPYCGSHLRLMALLSEHGIDELTLHEMAADEDISAFLDSNAGVAIIPRTMRRPDSARAVEIDGLELERTVWLYDVAGRRRSAAASALTKLLRSVDLLDEPN